MTIEQNFDIAFVAAHALREKQIQQNYRPIIAVHKWFARRPGTLFRSLVLAEFGERPLRQAFYEPNDFKGKRVADPFMGGGTPLLEANRVGCDVHGFDINPMSAWIVREEIEHLDLAAYREAADGLTRALAQDVDSLYRTDCPIYGDKNVPVKYFIWVKELDCEQCREPVALLPGYLIAENVRHPRNVMVCAACSSLNEVEDRDEPGRCLSCRRALVVQGPAKRGKCPCPKCGHVNRYPRPLEGAPRHRLIAIEYYNPRQKQVHQGRFFKAPDSKDLKRVTDAQKRWASLDTEFVPTEAIPAGDETDRLHRWGYNSYRDLFNSRQLLGLELSARLIAKVADERVRHALATNLSDLLRYQNMLCRYDSMALKSLDVFSVHGFPVGLVQCESNLLGISNGNGASVGSGGWTNIIDKYEKAKAYCDAPFEVQNDGARKRKVQIPGEWIGEKRPGARSRRVSIQCASATDISLKAGTLDAVFTDPPYFGNVQYGELMDFCFVWLRRLAGPGAEGFAAKTTRATGELTGNATQGKGLEHFTEGLSAVYSRMARALKPGAPLVFTYHHNRLEAYAAIGVAILDAGLTCSASIPCPGEMGGSIHIHGTNSSILDTVFVCRMSGTTAKLSLFRNRTEFARVVADDLGPLRQGGVKPTRGDTRCITFGHATRMAVWNLRAQWNPALPTSARLQQFMQQLAGFGDLDAVAESTLSLTPGREGQPPERPLFAAAAGASRRPHAVSF